MICSDNIYILYQILFNLSLYYLKYYINYFMTSPTPNFCTHNGLQCIVSCLSFTHLIFTDLGKLLKRIKWNMFYK